MTIQRARASFASSGSPAGTGSFHHEPVPPLEELVGDPHRATELLLRRGGQRDVVADRGAHLLAVPGHQQRCGQHDLRLETVGLHDLPSREQVVQLVGPAELHVRLDRDRVVRLHQRIEQLRDRDRLTSGVAAGEVVALEHLRDGHHPRELDDVGERQAGEPLAVPPYLRPLGDEDLEGLLEVRLRVPVDLVVREDRALARPPGRVADPRRVVADDEHAGVTLVLEGAHALQRDSPADVDVR